MRAKESEDGCLLKPGSHSAFETRWVKSVEEYYGNRGVRSESYTSELESFKLAD
jgi:hypothetical protein